MKNQIEHKNKNGYIMHIKIIDNRNNLMKVKHDKTIKSKFMYHYKY